VRNLALLLALLAVACSGITATTTTTGLVEPPCESPPAAEIEAPSQLEVTVDPSPARPRERVELAVASTGLPDDALAGIDAAWQCWDGSRWVTTHVVYRGFGDNVGQTIPINADFQIRVPSIGLALDDGYPIVIPQVAPGRYRIEDEIVVDGGSVPGFAIVEVVEG